LKAEKQELTLYSCCVHVSADILSVGTSVQSRARPDGNVLFFPDSGVQVALLPGGMAVASPLRVNEMKPFVIETTFLMKPDCRKRVVRCYNNDSEWINTVFLSEKRIG
jgi:hypothetical protein